MKKEQKRDACARTKIEEADALAKQQGWTLLNEQEKALINLLRFTTYSGRNLVMETAIAMQLTRPWMYGPGTRKSNTETAYPDTDLRFFSSPKEDRP